MAASSANDSDGELAGEGIWCLIFKGLEPIPIPPKEWVLCISAVTGVRGMQKLWDLDGVCSSLYMEKSKELFNGVDSGVRGEVSSAGG